MKLKSTISKIIEVEYPDGYYSEAIGDSDLLDAQISHDIRVRVMEMNQANKLKRYHENIQFKITE